MDMGPSHSGLGSRSWIKAFAEQDITYARESTYTPSTHFNSLVYKIQLDELLDLDSIVRNATCFYFIAVVPSDCPNDFVAKYLTSTSLSLVSACKQGFILFSTIPESTW